MMLLNYLKAYYFFVNIVKKQMEAYRLEMLPFYLFYYFFVNVSVAKSAVSASTVKV